MEGKHWMSPKLASGEGNRFLVFGLMEIKEEIESK
jgi:hypothetical protein